jgi:hypothetical protein
MYNYLFLSTFYNSLWKLWTNIKAVKEFCIIFKLETKTFKLLCPKMAVITASVYDITYQANPWLWAQG